MYDPKGLPLVKKVKLARKRPILYQDVDGCLFGTYDGVFQLRPGVSSYLKWACTHFEVRWLTCWSEEEIRTLMWLLYVNEKRLGVPVPTYQDWGALKAEAIDPRSDFYWVDDAPDFADMDVLKAAGKLDRFILCDSIGENGLVEVRQKLEAILAARESAA